jgi:hypothetical protein
MREEVTAAFSFTGHSGVMVPVFAYGPGAIEFTGIQENTGIFHDMFRLLFPAKKEMKRREKDSTGLTLPWWKNSIRYRVKVQHRKGSLLYQVGGCDVCCSWCDTKYS